MKGVKTKTNTNQNKNPANMLIKLFLFFLFSPDNIFRSSVVCVFVLFPMICTQKFIIMRHNNHMNNNRFF